MCIARGSTSDRDYARGETGGMFFTEKPKRRIIGAPSPVTVLGRRLFHESALRTGEVEGVGAIDVERIYCWNRGLPLQVAIRGQGLT
jgi:hypothetical protein